MTRKKQLQACGQATRRSQYARKCCTLHSPRRWAVPVGALGHVEAARQAVCAVARRAQAALALPFRLFRLLTAVCPSPGPGNHLFTSSWG